MCPHAGWALQMQKRIKPLKRQICEQFKCRVVARSCPALCYPMDCMQHTRLSFPSLSPGVCSNSCPLSPWCHPTISSCYPLFLLLSITGIIVAQEEEFISFVLLSSLEGRHWVLGLPTLPFPTLHHLLQGLVRTCCSLFCVTPPQQTDSNSQRLLT